MLTKRTDLALEGKELFEESAGSITQMDGVRAKEYERRGYHVTAIDVLDGRGSKAIGKPMGKYVTIDLSGEESGEAFEQKARCMAEELRKMLPCSLSEKSVLVAGLGNRSITPDAIGPQAIEQILITRHLKESLPEEFSIFSSVCAVAPGVLGTTGLESAEFVRGLVEKVKPSCLIVIDALVSRRMQRLCRTVQLSDTGLVPGSGIGNHRKALNEETLHLPVLSVGVPTVIDAATLAADLLEGSGVEDAESVLPSPLQSGVIVTTKEIDAQVRELSKLVAYGINLALHRSLTVEDITAFLQ